MNMLPGNNPAVAVNPATGFGDSDKEGGCAAPSGFFYIRQLGWPFNGRAERETSGSAGAFFPVRQPARFRPPVWRRVAVLQSQKKETTMAQSTITPAVFSGNHYLVTEDSHYAIYQARHLLGLLYDMSGDQRGLRTLNLEHMAVSGCVITDLMDGVFPDLVCSSKGVGK